MARQDDFVHCTCDRCGKDSYLLKSDPKLASEYVEVERVTAQDVHEKPLLCKECLRQYKNFAAGQDNDYREFMNGGNA